MMEQQSAIDGIGAGAAVSTNDRPLSLYDNLTTMVASAPGAGSGGRTIHFPDIQFRFDESIAATTQPLDRHRRPHHTSARSNFFGLSSSSTSPPGRTDADNGDEQEDRRNGRTTPLPPEAPSMASSTPSASRTDDAVDMSTLSVPDASASPNSTASTVLLSSACPSPARESPGQQQQQQVPVAPRISRPNSTIKSITIQLPPDAAINRGSLSEAIYMTTTVPQNFAKNASTLIGRHKPTRSSLRHSRMLLQNSSSKAYQQQRYQRGNSFNLRHLGLSKGLMVLQILIGALLSLIGLTIMVWSPSTHTKDNPYWSGLTLILCGTMFLVLFAFKRPDRRQRLVVGSGGKASVVVTAAAIGATTDRPPVSRNCVRENCFHVLRVNALVVLVLTIFFTLLAFIYALIHATNLSSPDLRCVPEFSFNVNASTCVCTLDPHRTVPERPGGEASPPAGTNRSLEDDGHRLEYRDFNCNEVLSIWYYVMIVSTVLNSLGCLLAASFLLIYGIECMRNDGMDHAPALLQRKTNGESAPTGHGEMETDGGTAAEPEASFKHRDSASNQPLLTTVRILNTNLVEAKTAAADQQPDSAMLRARGDGSDQELSP
ncbi:uncharacterized protein LOC126570774 [Anopheles aquasalis]|uniref:uncharacterized protein LOC126570774 n=1 Tax=Anopheles aquasalis TaxID=42839 RepID=UPI00215B1654|nr:uncharacterized protein LOC126570774 [Anopheles aquasalis]